MSRTRLAKAPYNTYGDLMVNIPSRPGDVPEWRENKPFRAMLILDDTERELSSARFVWHNSHGGHAYRMFMTDMANLVKSANNLYKGSADTWWIAERRGKNYGIRLADQDDLKAARHTGGARETCRACDDTNPKYETLCPLRPESDKAHSYEEDLQAWGTPIRPCRCGLSHKHHIHGCSDKPLLGCPCDTCREHFRDR
ncbi:hypothetical protein OG497_38145 [Streptomyces sp. NBC_01242]|uniref:hypothetical protein n=1 Tax=Streptomyces sp. NBC_01242 TaxID=2903795 RepID=UPI0022556E24|nr:hypothetical protein [Streptomyces sp. NBC_01242]MCX4799682.1 hypothetical protein [Streptomyces sp. NBC_01242]